MVQIAGVTQAPIMRTLIPTLKTVEGCMRLSSVSNAHSFNVRHTERENPQNPHETREGEVFITDLPTVL